MFIDPNDFSGSDIEKIQSAVQASLSCGGVVRIPRRKADSSSSRDFWLIDSAILLPEGTTVILANCRIKLSDECRDNFFRSANCGPGIGEVKELSSIHILGVGSSVLEGADRPRATGDSGKTLGERTFGTDAGKEGREQKGDWREIGILFAHVNDFSISNISIVNSHCWAISLEYCRNGKVRDVHFQSRGTRFIDGKEVPNLNQDGLDLRRGCRHILIENITGSTGDDLIALTGLEAPVREAGIFGSTAICGSTGIPELEEIAYITIRNVCGHCAGGHHIVRFLNNKSVKMHHILLDGLMDTSSGACRDYAAIRIGDAKYGLVPFGGTSSFQISHVQSRAKAAILISGTLSESTISDVINWNPDTVPVTVSPDGGIRNVVIENARTYAGE